jgi:hypothetical protein
MSWILNSESTCIPDLASSHLCNEHEREAGLDHFRGADLHGHFSGHPGGGVDATTSSWAGIIPETKEKLKRAVRSRELQLFLLVFVLLFISIMPLSGSNEKSHFALTAAMVSNHSFVITGYAPFATPDVSNYSGASLSALDPGLSVLLLVPFAIGTFLGPLINPFLGSFAVAGYATGGQVLLVQLFSAICTAVSAVYVYKLCLAIGSKRTSATATGLVYAFATLVWVYGKTSFAHTYSALFLVVAYYYLFRGTIPRTRDLLFAGISAALAVSVEYTNLLLLLPALVLLATKRGKSAKEYVAFLPPIVAGASLLLLYNYVCFGNPLVFPENHWVGYGAPVSDLLKEFSTPLPVGLRELLFSTTSGLLVYCPILVLAVPSFFLLAKTRRKEALVLASVFVINFVVYATWHEPSGGGSYGPRYLVASLPFLVVPMSLLIESIYRARSTIPRRGGAFCLTGLFSASALISSLGAVTSATGSFTIVFLQILLGHPTALFDPRVPLFGDLAYPVFFDAARCLNVSEPAAAVAFWLLLTACACGAFALALRDVRMELAAETRGPQEGSSSLGR